MKIRRKPGHAGNIGLEVARGSNDAAIVVGIDEDGRGGLRVGKRKIAGLRGRVDKWKLIVRQTCEAESARARHRGGDDQKENAKLVLAAV